MGFMKKGSTKPTKEEIAAALKERRDENLVHFCEGVSLAAEAWGRKPTVEMAAGARQILEGGIERELVAPVLAEAIGIVERLGGDPTKDVGSVLSVFDVLVEDDLGVEHLAEAEAEAKATLSDVTCEAVIEVYYQIYGEDDEPDPDEDE